MFRQRLGIARRFALVRRAGVGPPRRGRITVSSVGAEGILANSDAFRPGWFPATLVLGDRLIDQTSVIFLKAGSTAYGPMLRVERRQRGTAGSRWRR
jgi:hypothetical protein